MSDRDPSRTSGVDKPGRARAIAAMLAAGWSPAAVHRGLDVIDAGLGVPAAMRAMGEKGDDDA